MGLHRRLTPPQRHPPRQLRTRTHPRQPPHPLNRPPPRTHRPAHHHPPIQLTTSPPPDSNPPSTSSPWPPATPITSTTPTAACPITLDSKVNTWGEGNRGRRQNQNPYQIRVAGGPATRPLPTAMPVAKPVAFARPNHPIVAAVLVLPVAIEAHRATPLNRRSGGARRWSPSPQGERGQETGANGTARARAPARIP